jgi:uncharacterized repeat protein (TIGR01451 family)
MPSITTTNRGKATGNDILGYAATDYSQKTVNVIHPAIKLVKTVDKLVIYSGEEVNYTYRVNNTGDVTLSNIKVTDNTGLVPAYVSGDANGNAKLETSETWLYKAKANPTADVTNIGNATGTDTTNRDVYSTSTAQVDVIHPGIKLVKVVDKPVTYSGEVVKYTYIVNNTGDVNLTGITVTDNMGLVPTLVAGDDGDNVLELSVSWVYQVFSSPTSDVTNIGRATGIDPSGRNVYSTDDASVDVIHPGIGIQKIANKPVIYSGEEVIYTFLIRNTGDVNLANIRLNDSTGLVPIYSYGDDGDRLLELSETWTYRATAHPTADVTNIGMATGTDTSGRDLFNTSTAFVDVIHPGIDLIKTADKPIIYSGEEVNYTYRVSNTGDATLSNITLTDDTGIIPHLMSGDDGDGVLEALEVWTYIALANPVNDITNKGYVEGTDATGRKVSKISTAQVDVIHPKIGLAKSSG